MENYTVSELAALAPLGQEGIGGVPTLKEVLSLIGGKVPLIIEIKADSALYKEITQKTLAQLKEYEGEFVIESFHPGVLKIVRKANKRICRGQLCAWYSVKGKRLPFYFEKSIVFALSFM